MRSIVTVAVLCGCFLGVQSAQGQALCADLAAHLRDEYREIPMGVGLTPQGNLVELFVAEHHSFTILVTAPSGLSCLLAAGSAWSRADPQLPSSGTVPEATH